MYVLIPYLYFPPLSFPLPTSNHYFVFWSCESVSISVIFISLFYFLDSTHVISYHTPFVFLCQTYFTYLQVHPPCCKWQNFVLFYGWVVFYCIYSGIFFINASIHGYLGCSHKLAVANNAAYKHWVHVSFSSSASAFLGIYTGAELLGHMVVLFLVFGN